MGLGAACIWAPLHFVLGNGGDWDQVLDYRVRNLPDRPSVTLVTCDTVGNPVNFGGRTVKVVLQRCVSNASRCAVTAHSTQHTLCKCKCKCKCKCNVHLFSLGLSNPTEGQQVYSSIWTCLCYKVCSVQVQGASSVMSAVLCCL
jgi:hypothetical protein